MESAAETREPTMENHHTLKVEEEEEDEKDFGLERKTSLFRNGKGHHDSSEGSSTVTTTNTSSSSSSFSGDATEVAAVFSYVQGEHTESSEQEDVHDERTIVYFNGGEQVNPEAIDQPAGDLIVEEKELEVEEYDVEKVLTNQETHDLICPKCKTCITKKVILQRRKRKLPNVPEGAKRPRFPYRNDAPLHSDDNSLSPGGDPSSVHESFVVKCLSCFSIFIPTWVGPKPLPDTGGVESSNFQPKPQEKPTGNSSWFGSIFGFNQHGSDPAQGKPMPSEPETNPGADGQTHIDIDTSSTDGNHTSGKGRLSPIKQSPGNVTGAADTAVTNPPSPGTDIPLSSQVGTLNEPLLPVVERPKVEILKSIVYGGLLESMTSLGVISSAAGSGATTLNILVLGLANLFGGLILLIHNLQELREEEQRPTTTTEGNRQETESRYKRLLGRRENFAVHAFFAILSFIITGLLPPVVYYFSFSETHNKDYKVASVFGSSLLCIVFLAIAKAHVKTPRGGWDSYVKSVMYYAVNAVSVSGITYVAGNVVDQLLEKYGWGDGSETPAGHMMAMSLMGRKAGGFGYSSSY